MVIQRTRFVVLLVLCPLLAPPVAAQNEEGFEGSPTDFLPLQVGNQWTYRHWYVNNLYNRFEIVEGVVRQYGARAILEYDPLSFQWMRVRMIAEIHGYPLTARYERESPLFDLLYSYTDLTIEITHTETIEGHTYFVFSEPAHRLMMEIPGYPLSPGLADLVWPPDDLRFPVRRELTIEITHTETIEGHEYFVFSEPYDWPPVPTLCLAGQKVRFSDVGVLFIRQQEQDIPLYNFASPYEYGSAQIHSDKEYTTLAYPVLYDAHDPVRLPLLVRRSSWDARLRSRWYLFYPPPLSFGPAFVTHFVINPGLGDVYFLANYGFARYEVWEPGWDLVRVFENSLAPVSAVIGGKEIAYPYVFVGTSVQPTSWGQLKARHGQEP